MIALVVGLGNVGARYAGTRHNVGFTVIDRVFESLGASRAESTSLYDVAFKEAEHGGVWLAWPAALMNRSGLAAKALLEKTGLEPARMLVVVDDFNLPLGKIRLRPSGSDGGHHGLASICQVLGTDEYPRLRLGIGPTLDNVSAVDFVLGRFTAEEAVIVEKMVDIAAEAVIFALCHRFEEAMTKFNVNPAFPE